MRSSIGRAGAFLAIEEVEAHDIEALISQHGGELDHAAVVAMAAGTVRGDENGGALSRCALEEPIDAI